MKQPIETLRNAEAGRPGFVLGNGLSRTFYDPMALVNHGVILGCNDNFIYADYQGCRDDEFLVPLCVGFTGRIIAYGLSETVPHEHHLQKREKDVYFYDWVGKDGTKPESYLNNVNRLVKGYTGLLMTQVAYILGCNPIVLIGFDSCTLPGYKTNNVMYDSREKTGAQTGLDQTRPKMEALNRHVWDSGRRLFKLGAFGVLDIPVIQIEDIVYERIK